MSRITTPEALAVAGSGLAGVLTIALSIAFRDQIDLVPRGIARPVGLLAVGAGMALFLWAASKLGGGVMGGVRPRGALVADGPFRIVRHPGYLGMAIAMIGVGLVTRSLIGLAAALLLFVPAEWHRARLEDRALQRRFGEAWRHYAARTGGFLPVRGRHP